MRRLTLVLFVLAVVAATKPSRADLQLHQPLPLLRLGGSESETILPLGDYIRDSKIPGTAVRIRIRIGAAEKAVDLALYDEETPQSVANFLAYIDAGLFESNIFHRLVPGFVLQGGGFRLIDDATFDSVPTFPPILNEPRFSNVRGTVAMAKIAENPDSATSQWFFNLADNSANLDEQNGGFTVFGHVLGDGMEVVDEVAALPIYNASGFHGAWTNLPLSGYSGGGLLRHHLIETSATRVAPVAFSAVADRPDLVAVSIEDAELVVTPFPDAFGEAEIRVTAAGLSGSVAEFELRVRIGETYQSWREARGFPDGSAADPMADPDADGFANLLEFAFGGEPLEAGIPAFAPRAEEGGGVRFGVRRRTFLRYSAIASTDLRDWSEVWTSDHGLASPAVAEHGSEESFDWLTVRAEGASGKRFWRIRVERMD